MVNERDLFESVEDLNQLTLEVFNLYRGLILKKALFYSRVSRNRIEKEDFMSEVFLNLHKLLSYLKKDKIKSENFSFYLSVRYAIIRTWKKQMRVINQETISLDETDEEGNPIRQIPCTKYCFNPLELNKKPFLNQLSPRQRKILELKNQGLVYKDIQKKLGTSYGIIPIEIRKIRLIAQDYF